MADDPARTGEERKVPSVPPSLPESFQCPHCGKAHAIFMARCPESGQTVDRVFKMQGQLLEGKYRVGRMLAQGGMGVVYEGTHTKIGRKLAIKFLLGTAMANREVVARFQNEARIAASIGHRNIVDILDMGTTQNGIPFIVMEYLDGRDLGTVLDATVRLPQPLAVEICIQILGALRSVHERDIVHRDLKPENVFVVREPDIGITVKLVDFGISRLAPARKQNLSLTRTGAVFGTPRYMAPEQARGKKSVDHRADLYSVGVMLYELLTGAIPFEADDYNNMIIAITTEDPLSVSQHGVLIDEDLCRIVMKAITRDPAGRYQGADEFIQELLPHRISDMASVDISGVLAVSGGGPEPPILIDGSSISGMRHTPVHDNPTLVPENELSHPSMQPWEGAIRTQPPPGGHKRSILRTVLVVTAIPIMILVAAGLMALIVLEMMDVAGGRADATQARGTVASEPGPPTPPAPSPPPLEIDIQGIPDGAQVLVDGTLHPERPVMVEEMSAARVVTIVAEGFEPWEKKVAVHSNVTLHVTLSPVPAPEPVVEPEPEPEPEKKPPASKKDDAKPGKGKQGDKGTKPTKGSKIDMVYPGLKQ